MKHRVLVTLALSLRFRDVATYSLKLSIEDCETAAVVTIENLQEVASALTMQRYHRRLSTTYRLATIHLWQTDGQTTTNMPIARLLLQ